MTDEPQTGEGQKASGPGSSAPETKGHQAPETRGHEPPASGQVELGHPAAEGVVIVQSVGEMHSPATEAPAPTAAPPKPTDAAQSVRPPQAREDSATQTQPAPSSGEAPGE